MKRIFVTIIFAASLIGCKSQNLPVSTFNSNPIAFPGAEGFGKFATGGRGGEVMIISNLNDQGKGSFREAVESKKPAIIVFAVSAAILLNSKLSISSDENIQVAT